MRTLSCVAFAVAAACTSTTYVVSHGQLGVMTTDVPAVPGAKVYHDDLFGNGLVSAVAANPAASERARIYRDRTHTAFIVSMLSLGCLAIDGVAAANATDSTGALPKGGIPVFAGIALACSVTGLVSSVVGMRATYYANDAIAIFNAYPTPAQAVHLLAAPSPTASASLRMRDP